MSIPDSIDELLRGILAHPDYLSYDRQREVTMILNNMRVDATDWSRLRDIWVERNVVDVSTMSLEMYIRGQIMPALKARETVFEYMLTETAEDWVIKKRYPVSSYIIYMRVNKTSEMCFRPGGRMAVAYIRNPDVLTLFSNR